jgi:hypothetical protein
MTKFDLALRLARESGLSAAEAADLLDEAVQKILKTAKAANAPLRATGRIKIARASSRSAKPKGNPPDLASAREPAARKLPGSPRRGRLGRRIFSAGSQAASNKSPAGAFKRPQGRPAKKAAKPDRS